MFEQNKKFILIAGIGIAGILALVLISTISNTFVAVPENGDEVTTQPPTVDMSDVTQDFFNNWLVAIRENSADAILTTLPNDIRISDEVRTYITDSMADKSRTLDPVLCQSEVPERIGVKVSFQNESNSQLLVLSRGLEEKSSNLSVVDLSVVNNEWQITGISCSSGETAPDREFSFEKEGFLLKSVPPPLNPEYWHVVFEENGQMGHTAPLFFSENSTCVTGDNEETCDENSFIDATKATVKGEMTESGVEVKFIEF